MSVKKVAFGGQALNIDELFQIKLSLNKFQNDQKLDELLFWGKITGAKKDYFIALGINYTLKYEFPEKKFFYCLSGEYDFKELPEIDPQHADHAEKFNGYFTGDPNTVLVQLEAKEENKDPGQPAEPTDGTKVEAKKVEEESDEEKVVKPPLKDFKEINRLSFVVRAIENDNHVVPEGAFKLTSEHEIRRNKNYIGLHSKDLSNVSKYMHFRNVQSATKKELLNKDDSIYCYDIFDKIEDDKPNGFWSIISDAITQKTEIKSFLWPGYFAYHIGCTKMFGGAYIGSGIKNKEVAFML